MAGGSETLASPMGAPACGIKVAAQAGLQPWFQHSRHTSRAAITPESTAAKRTLVCRSFGIGSPITGIYDTSYYTATPHPSSIQQPRCRNFRLPERKTWTFTVTAYPQATTNKTAKQQRNKSANQQHKRAARGDPLFCPKPPERERPISCMISTRFVSPDAACQCGRPAALLHQTAQGAARVQR